MAEVKPGIYREPLNGHVIEVFAGTAVIHPGYEYIASSEEYRAGKGPGFTPVDAWEHRPETPQTSELVQGSEEKQREQAENKARTTTAKAKA